MIYLSDDYMNKYEDVLSYLLSRSIQEKYSFPYIEKTISYSIMIGELERSNITTIAFSSMEKIYSDIFPLKENKNFILNVYDAYGWAGNTYMHLFLDFQMTFEAIFIILPIQLMLNLYHLYHEMSYSQIIGYFKALIPYSCLDSIMKAKKISTNEASNETGIPFSTLKSLRYGKRDITKVESGVLFTLARYLDVKMESLLPNIHLSIEDY